MRNQSWHNQSRDASLLYIEFRMKGIVCRGLFHDDLLLQCNDPNGRALPTSHCGGVSGPCIHIMVVKKSTAIEKTRRGVLAKRKCFGVHFAGSS
jgi:hypothetical protein